MEASRAGHVECLKVLLDNGAEANLQNKVSVAPNYMLKRVWYSKVITQSLKWLVRSHLYVSIIWLTW